MDLFEKYMSERQGAQVLKDESGFIFYKISGEECYIVDMYTDSSMQGEGKGREMINKLSQLASDQGCTFLSGKIRLNDRGANQTLISALLVGFQVVDAFFSEEGKSLGIIKRIRR